MVEKMLCRSGRWSVVLESIAVAVPVASKMQLRGAPSSHALAGRSRDGQRRAFQPAGAKRSCAPIARAARAGADGATAEPTPSRRDALLTLTSSLLLAGAAPAVAEEAAVASTSTVGGPTGPMLGWAGARCAPIPPLRPRRACGRAVAHTPGQPGPSGACAQRPCGSACPAGCSLRWGVPQHVWDTPSSKRLGAGGGAPSIHPLHPPALASTPCAAAVLQGFATLYDPILAYQFDYPVATQSGVPLRMVLAHVPEK